MRVHAAPDCAHGPRSLGPADTPKRPECHLSLGVPRNEAWRVAAQAMWILGPTAMLVTSVATTAIVAHLDHHNVPDKRFDKMLRRVETHTLSLHEGGV